MKKFIKICYAIAALVFCGYAATAQQLIITITAVPTNTPAASNLYIAGTFNNWNPADPAYQLQKNTTNNTYTVSVPCGNGNIQYKFTRGSWATVEADAQGNDISNRNFVCNSGNNTTHQIISWKDFAPSGGGGHTAAANVTIISNNFAVPQLGTTRRVWAYLPPDYAQNPHKSYPVIYMHDGQNLFDDYYSFAGEWGIDETLNQLSAAGNYGCIVIGIDNGGASRINEYSPWNNPTYGGGQGAQYMNFVVNTLKPYIDANYRTQPGRNTTAIGGSSLGALISMYGAIEHQNVFSKALIFSPAFWFSSQCFAHVSSKGKQQNMRFYMLCGQNEGSNMANYQTQMKNTLINAGFSNTDITDIAKPDGQHSEWFWKREFGAGYQWLFAPNVSTDNTPEPPEEIRIIANPFDDSTVINLPESQRKAKLTITNMQGQQVIKRTIRSGEMLRLSHLPTGIYTITIATNKQIISQKIIQK